MPQRVSPRPTRPSASSSWAAIRRRSPRRGRSPSRRGAASVVFTGQQPAREIPAFVAAAAVLASPRIRGTNTPLKIYSYLRSGRPIVATNLLTHTQVLSGDVARLTPPEAAPFAAAIAGLLDDPAAGRVLADAAGRLSDARYSRQVYLSRTAEACRRLVARGAAALEESGSR